MRELGREEKEASQDISESDKRWFLVLMGLLKTDMENPDYG